MSLMMENTDGHFYASTFAGFYVNETGTRSGCPNPHRLFWSRLGAWIVPAAERLGGGTGILVAPCCVLLFEREGQADLSVQESV